jgi:hypothetical protein
MTIAHPRPDIAVKPLEGVEPTRSVHVMWVRNRVTPGLAPMLAALADAAEQRL